MTESGTIIVKEPPICDCCKRKVKSTSSKPFLLGAPDMLCKDCWGQWYDPDYETGNTREGIGDATIRKHGHFGGEADLTEILEARKQRADNWLGEGI
jgi:hypothetical protein